ncbi:MAG TPA: FumA C-terminus/TtdB family hydratase beta subunit [Gemmatales bacterium]|nr:FumA C-terminus/TtdB family hydratase beta subunit [Gemmatales bacterium]HMP59827.1 FumA C-terminus/TtdB family hydratase beta subunit [Gemmatales bacterium]
MNRDAFFKQMLELVRRTSAFLPPDVESVLAIRQALENPGSKADLALRLVLQNIGLAKRFSAPICQDTGTIGFYIKTPVGFDQLALQEICCDAVVEATRKGYLRQNSVDSLTGRNTGNNLGAGSPVFHWHQHRHETVDARLILKGGGCENMSAQYSLPTTINGKRCDRDLEGVRDVVLDAIWQAQGKGCGPGFIGVCIGGDRAQGYDFAKEQLLRTVEDVNPVPELAAFEDRIMKDANQLNIGPMGFGGKLTIGGCKIGARNRLPASFFVSVAYMCWAYRRRGVVLDTKGNVQDWLYHAPGEFDHEPEPTSNVVDLGNKVAPGERIIPLTLPLSEADVRSLRAGDVVMLSGMVLTGRDEVHKFLFKGGDVPAMQGGVIYHCGPVVLEEGGKYRVVAAGPTTSIREEPYQADVIARYGIKAVIGKGGMGAKTLAACKEHGCVYLHAIGGAAQIYAQCVTDVPGVFLKEKFGSPEAVWQLVVKDFPAVVTMDAHGRSLHAEVADASKQELAGVL